MGFGVTHNCRTSVAARKFATVPLKREPLSHRSAKGSTDWSATVACIAAASVRVLRLGYEPRRTLGCLAGARFHARRRELGAA